ncbi:MAG TPA: RNA-binding S4 domain-containing protein [Rhizomicrobium sp.]
MTDHLRIDKWLWHARFYKTRPIAQKAARSGVLRLNGHRVEKSSVEIGPGDLVTIPRGPAVVVVRVIACGERRGPASEARALYELLEDDR